MPGGDRASTVGAAKIIAIFFVLINFCAKFGFNMDNK